MAAKLKQGCIIAVSGGPRSGKSTLVSILAKSFKGISLLEGEEQDFPARILTDIAQGNNIFQTQLWFRNKIITQYLKAIELSRQGKIVILDTFWMTNNVYTKALITSSFENQLFNEISTIDSSLLPLPDLVISLSTNEKKIREFMEEGGRKLEQNESHIQKNIDLNHAHAEYFKELNIPAILAIDRSEIDFFDKTEVQKLIQQVRDTLLENDSLHL